METGDKDWGERLTGGEGSCRNVEDQMEGRNRGKKGRNQERREKQREQDPGWVRK